MRSSKVTAAALILSSALAGNAYATDYLSGSVGWFDIIDQDNESTHLGLEYRFNPWQYGFRPTVGANLTTDGALYGYGGFHWDVPLVDNELYLVPNFVAGLYSEGDGKDLGGAIQFRSGIELQYQMPNTHRVGVAFNHISNASIYDKNPGVETLLINYSVPMGLFGR
jgi:lipid A 3-O-deacylase